MFKVNPHENTYYEVTILFRFFYANRHGSSYSSE